MTPFKALYGFDHPQPSFELVAQTRLESVDQILRERQLLNKILKDNLTNAQNRIKHYADSKRSDRKFKVGDIVLRKIGKVAYVLKLPLGSKIHPVFHVSQLKKAVGNHVQPSKEPPICTDDGQVLTEPVAILGRRIMKKGNKGATQVLAQWENLSKDEAT
ncbi:uncharacterized protein [Nicotiana tomentosiformis]|uniref:uncharacterized protein n=1 Tax=Nicotiana tomentosiformis TaxID=4098 RepID=UPI00388C68BD